MNYTIYQSKKPTFRVDDSQVLYNQSDYNEIYNAKYLITDEADDIEILETLFEIYNIRRPTDFKGHSLSVGDIIDLDGRLYVCCNCGWKEIKWEV